jgi:hypothetical protein
MEHMFADDYTITNITYSQIPMIHMYSEKITENNKQFFSYRIQVKIGTNKTLSLNILIHHIYILHVNNINFILSIHFRIFH